MSALITVEDIAAALDELGGDARAVEIQDRVILNRGGSHRFLDERSCRGTIQRTIEDWCPQRKGFKGGALFESFEYGRYRLCREVVESWSESAKEH